MVATADIKKVFENAFSDIKADAKLAKRISDFQIEFINKNEDHLAFFGGNLTGAHVVRFTPKDREKFFTDVCQVDELEIEDKLLQVPAVKKDRIVSSDVFNQTCMWLIHMFANSSLPEKAKEQAMVDVALILHFRFITSILFRDYKYPVDPQVATATYAQLSFKFAIKQYGSWYATLEARSKELTKPDGLHYNTFLHYNDDEDIIYLINDTQGRIRDMMKNLYRELKKVLNQGSKIKTTSNIIELDNEQIFKDKTKSLLNYTRYMQSIVGDKDVFIKQEILDVLEKIVFTAPPKLVRQTLEWCSANHRYVKDKEVEEFIEKTVINSFEYLANNRTVYRETTDLAEFVARLRGIYMASRMNDPEIIELRDRAEKIVRKATTTKNSSVVSAVRTAILLYVVIRAFTMSHYSGVQ